MSYAVYVRVSTDRDEQVSSVENQVDICRNWLERNGFEWDENNIYKDEGISGTLFINRPAIQLILSKAKKKEIETVVFKSISRLARDLKDSLEIREVLIAHNVRIISIEEGYDSNKVGKNDMAFELWSLFSAQYSRTLSSGISAALAAKVRRGEHIGKIPYGYDRIGQKLVLNNEESKVIRQIFEWYLNGWGFKTITKELNDLGVKSKTGRKWQVTSIQRIIRSPIYCGTFILNQYSSIKTQGRKKQIRNPEDKWIIFEDHHPAIIKKEEWEKANNKEVTNKKTKITPWNEFRGIMKCKKCGSNMVIVQSSRKKKDGTVTKWQYLKCSAYRRAGNHGCVNHEPIKYEDFREFIIKLLIKKGHHVVLQLENELEKRKSGEVIVLNNKIGEIEEKKKDLLDVYLDKLISKEEFELKRKKLDGELLEIEKRLFLYNQQNHTQDNIDNIKDAFSRLQNYNENLLHVFRTLVDEIYVHVDGTIDIKYSFENVD